MRRIGTMLCALALAAAPAGARAQQDAAPADGAGRLSGGVQLVWPAYGFSAMYDVNERVSAQAVVGSAGYGLSLTGRGILNFVSDDETRQYTPYVFGAVGTWTGYEAIGAVPHFGGGAGARMDLRELDADLPPLAVSFEGGITVATFSGGSYTLFSFGPGIHYRF
jgi:hypothetical protein